MCKEKRRKVKIKLPDGVSLPEGVELPAVEIGEATLRKTIIGEDGKAYETEEKIELPIIKSEEK